MVSSPAEPKRNRRDRRNGRPYFTKKSKQTNSQPKKDKPVETPHERLLDNHKHNLFSSTFEMLVGKGESQQMFAVHETVAERSKFFRLRMQKRWNAKDEAQITLVDEDPHLFSVYLHTVYFGAEHLEKQIAPGDDASSTDVTENAKFLIDLYVLADRLLDPVTADLVIEELISILYDVDDLDGKVSSAIAIHVNASTKDGSSPLRNLVRDLLR